MLGTCIFKDTNRFFLIDTSSLAVHLGAGRHAILLKNPVEYFKVSMLLLRPILSNLPDMHCITARLLYQYHLPRRHRRSQILHPPTLSPHFRHRSLYQYLLMDTCRTHFRLLLCRDLRRHLSMQPRSRVLGHYHTSNMH